MKRSLTLFSLVTVSLLAALAPCIRAEIVVPPPADQRVASTQLRVVPDRAGWTYKTGEPAKFKVTAFWDQQPLEQVAIKYRVGPEMLEVPEKTAVIPAEGLVIDGGTLNSPGFIRCVVTAEIDGRSYRGVATAGFSPEKITPTQANPTDFDAFWNSQKSMLAAIPLDPVLTLQPDLCTSKVDVYQLNLQSAGPYGNSTSRIYGILCVPKAEGKFPA
ncbi:MAG TPA: acetylxylan esterase, partial [Opitutaceae bacterium]|nr:acetylxylan esterase [Opitutaceae bacterium]